VLKLINGSYKYKCVMLKDLNKIHWCATVCSYTYRKIWYWSYCCKGTVPCKKQSHYRPEQAV